MAPRILIVDPYKPDLIRNVIGEALGGLTRIRHGASFPNGLLREGTDYLFLANPDEALRYLQTHEPGSVDRIILFYRSKPPAERKQLKILRSIEQIGQTVKQLNPKARVIGYDYDTVDPTLTINKFVKGLYEDLSL